VRALQFTFDVRHPQRRRIVVILEAECAVLAAGAPAAPEPRQDGVLAIEFFVPTWTPGSYLIREYARQFGPVRAFDAATGTALACRKTAKNRYLVEAPRLTRRVRLEYWVYAHELTVRTADVTPDHAYWNHACVALWPVGRTDLGAHVEVLAPPDWDCAAGLPVRSTGAGRFEFTAPSLDALVDAPLLLGKFTKLQRVISGVTHVVALDGLGAARVHERFLDHVQRIVEQAQAVFGGELPYSDYLFLALFADSGYGGLEHADSTTLLNPRTAMLRGKSYQEFLGLLAHELFHAWNVKRMRPVELWRYDYEAENLTPMLWLAEGWTAYYDDLLLRRARLSSADEYLALVAKNMASLWTSVGRFRQSLAESSFDAWIRHYRPDENTRNATQNYYGNGALAALVLDLTIRRATAGARSLDHAIAALYRETLHRGYSFDDVARCVSTAAGTDLEALLRALTHGPLDPDFEPLLADFGIAMQPIERDRPYLGFSLDAGRSTVSTVTDDSPAFEAGIAPGDEIIALDGIRVTSERWADVLDSVAAPGRPLRLLTASRGLVRERTLTPLPAPRNAVRLVVKDDVAPAVERLRATWLGRDLTADIDGSNGEAK
jgi:predicted metalloprotease with PDZ domain